MNLLRTLAYKIEPKLAQENQSVQQFALVDAVQAFAGGAPQSDDITLLLVTRPTGN